MQAVRFVVTNTALTGLRLVVVGHPVILLVYAWLQVMRFVVTNTGKDAVRVGGRSITHCTNQNNKT